MDIRTLYYREANAPEVYGGRYGLGSKDTTPGQIVAVYDNLEKAQPKDQFTIGINDDVTLSSLATVEGISTEPEGTIRCKFWGLGSDGTVGANKMQSRSSATRPISTRKGISPTTPRSPAA